MSIASLPELCPEPTVTLVVPRCQVVNTGQNRATRTRSLVNARPCRHHPDDFEEDHRLCSLWVAGAPRLRSTAISPELSRSLELRKRLQADPCDQLGTALKAGEPTRRQDTSTSDCTLSESLKGGRSSQVDSHLLAKPLAVHSR